MLEISKFISLWKQRSKMVLSFSSAFSNEILQIKTKDQINSWEISCQKKWDFYLFQFLKKINFVNTWSSVSKIFSDLLLSYRLSYVRNNIYYFRFSHYVFFLSVFLFTHFYFFFSFEPNHINYPMDVLKVRTFFRRSIHTAWKKDSLRFNIYTYFIHKKCLIRL
jgi:hypothetical protein